MLVGGRAGTLGTGLDLGEELIALFAVACKVANVLATVAGKRANEAGQLFGVSKRSVKGD